MELTTAMLADGAHVAGGKLYILGGQWDRLAGPTFPLQHPSLAVALVIKVDYDEALTSHTLNVSLMIDGEPVGPTAAGEMSTGHAPGQARGAPGFVSVAIPFHNVIFDTPGRYEWVITVDDEPIGHLPVEVVKLKLPGYGSGASPGA